MSSDQIFVGRTEELGQFKKTLQEPKGQAILVVGQAGMGKTLLVNKMAEIAQTFPGFECGCVRYVVASTDTVDTLMAQMMDNAFEAANTEPGSFDNVPERKKQWSAIFGAMGLIPVVGNYAEKLIALAGSLKHDPAKNTREQFLNRLELISKRMPKNGRAVFIVDPEKNMQDKSDEAWAIVVKDLPEKIKFIFAQRNEDVLVNSETFSGLNNVIRIPQKSLDALDESAIDELIGYEKPEINYPINEIKRVISCYNGNPYAVGAALGLLKAGTKLEELPKHPEPLKFAKMQWDKICEIDENAIKLFTAYAILEVGVPDDIVEYVSELKHSCQIQHLTANNYLKGLLREEGDGKKIYHSILSDYILGQMDGDKRSIYHKRAIKIYRGKLKKAEKEQTKPDELAAIRLPEHILKGEGENVFIDAFIYDCFDVLCTIGALDVCIRLSEQALKIVTEGSMEHAAILCYRGIIYQIRGETNKAEEMHKKSLETNKTNKIPQVNAHNYNNLGLIYQVRGEIDNAEEMQVKALEIFNKIGMPKAAAECYSNLAVICQIRGQFGKAEEMHKKLLEASKRTKDVGGMARDYSNLGVIYVQRGDLDRAKEVFERALGFAEKMNDKERIANNCSNIGNIYEIRNQWDEAEKMHKKALETNKNMGNIKGMAGDYSNLGVMYGKRGNLDGAEEMFHKAFEMSEKIGHKDGMAVNYANLGLTYRNQGKLDEAERMYNKALDISKIIGKPEGIANSYSNLGLIYIDKGDLYKAEGMSKKALEISITIGVAELTANTYINLGVIYKKQGDLVKAKESWEKSRDLHIKMGLQNKANEIQRLIDKINDEKIKI